MSAASDTALAALDWHWGDAYEITEALGVWRAARHDGAEELRDLIIADYAKQPVPRDGAK